MKKVVTFGELLLRLSTEKHQKFSQATSFNANYGSAEFNVAVSLANYGMDTEFITQLPDTDIGLCGLEEIRKKNVGSRHVALGGKKMGLYFLETGVGPRSGNVIYDRADSSMANIENGVIDWDTALQGVDWFHWSGITPAISKNAAQECLAALKVASKNGLTISVDLNYREKLWQYGKEPQDVMPELLSYCNVILGDLDSAFFMLGKKSVFPDYKNVESLPALYDILFTECNQLKIVATTLRYSINASHQKIGGILYNGKELFKTDLVEITQVIDRVGTGDAFMGGLIYGLLHYGKDYDRILSFAVTACCLKHTILGDYNLVKITEIEKIMGGDTSGRVAR